MLGFKTSQDIPYAPTHDRERRSWADARAALAHPIYLPAPVLLDLMRHGETATNAQGLVTGAQDVPLTSAGEEQARRIGHRLERHYQLAMHSTLERSRTTLDLAVKSGHIQVDRISSDARLNERSLGVLELHPWVPVDEYARGDLNYAPEGGDSYAEVARRCIYLLLDLVEVIKATRPEKILISGHMGPMRILLGIIEERQDPVQVLARSFGNTEVIRVRWERLVLPGFLRSLV